MIDIKESKAGHGLYEQTRLVTDDLLYGAMHGDVEQVRRALAGRANVNVQDGRFKITALNFGAITGNLAIVTELLDAGADPCIVDNFGILPAHRAAQLGFEEVTTKIVNAMLRMPPAEHNVRSTAANLFGEFLASILDKGWTAMAQDLFGWWSRAEATEAVPILTRWVQLGWVTTIHRAAGVLDESFWQAGGADPLLTAVEAFPQVVSLMLNKGVPAGTCEDLPGGCRVTFQPVDGEKQEEQEEVIYVI